VSMAPFGVPVVPPVYCRATRSFFGSIFTSGGFGGVDSSSGLKGCTPAFAGIECLGTFPSSPPKMRLAVGRYSPMLAAIRLRSFTLSKIFCTTGWSRSR